jgi:hypothetical protein
MNRQVCRQVSRHHAVRVQVHKQEKLSGHCAAPVATGSCMRACGLSSSSTGAPGFLGDFGSRGRKLTCIFVLSEMQRIWPRRLQEPHLGTEAMEGYPRQSAVFAQLRVFQQEKKGDAKEEFREPTPGTRLGSSCAVVLGQLVHVFNSLSFNNTSPSLLPLESGQRRSRSRSGGME